MTSHPLRIALMMQGGTNWLGGMNYIRNLAVALNSIPPNLRADFELCLLTLESLPTDFYEAVQPLFNWIGNLPELLPPKTLRNKLQWSLDKRLKRRKDPRLSSFLETTGFDFIYPYFSLDTPSLSVKTAAWIPDFQHKHLSHFFEPQELKARDRHYASIAQQSPCIVLSSEDARQDFLKFYGIAHSKTEVLSFVSIPDQSWYALDPVEVQRKYHLPDRFFLISNQFWKHKNHQLVFQALAQMKEQGHQVPVVCTGNVYDYRNPSYTDEILQTICTLGLSQQVFLLGALPRQEQLQLMRRCLAVIQPSLFEGWSTVVEDAKALGKPILLSDLRVHREQRPELAWFFGPSDATDLAVRIREAWSTQNPGPDLAAEEDARQRIKERTLTFAYQFLKIAGLPAPVESRPIR